MPDIVDRLRTAKACTQKTFLHSPDWAEGRKLLDEAAEIIKLRTTEMEKLQATYNDLLALQDQTDQVPLATALDAVGAALAALPRS